MIYKDMPGNRRKSEGIRGNRYTRIYKAMEGYRRVYEATERYKSVCKEIVGYTRVYKALE